MKGETLVINGDNWTIVDVAPAAPLAEMVAAILEDEGFVVMVRGADMLSDAFSHLGTTSALTSFVLVPEADGERALKLIADTVTDFEGDELDEMLDRMASGDMPAELDASAEGDDDEDADDD